MSWSKTIRKYYQRIFRYCFLFSFIFRHYCIIFKNSINNTLTKYYIYHGSYGLTYLTKRIRMFCIFNRFFSHTYQVYISLKISMSNIFFFTELPLQTLAQISYRGNSAKVLPQSSLKLKWYHQNARVLDWQHTIAMFGRLVFFNRQSAFLWVPTMLPFSRICFFILMRQTSYRGFIRTTTKKEKKLAPPFIFTFRYIDCVLSLNSFKFWWFWWSIYLIELDDFTFPLWMFHFYVATF